MTEKNDFKLDVVSIRLVKEAPIYSEQSFNKPEEVAAVMGECMCQFDREVVCVVNLSSDLKPINVHFASVGSLNEAMAHPRELFKPFKCDVEGNDKNYGFNVVNVNSTELVVFEAAIDLMSYVDIFADHESNKLALGMLADAPLATFLREHPQISFIRFCLDGDSPGRKAAAELMGKYYGLGYEVEDCPPPAGYKDYNEWLVATKLNLADQKKEQMTIAGQCH